MQYSTPLKMKHARKMVLVDVNAAPATPTTKPHPKTTNQLLVKTLNTLLTSNEYNRNEYGPKAKIVAELDDVMKKLIERKDLDPDEKLKFYSNMLNRYLHMIHTNDTQYAQTTWSAHPSPIHESEPDDGSFVEDSDSDDEVSEVSEVQPDVTMAEPPPPNISSVIQPKANSSLSDLLVPQPKPKKKRIKVTPEFTHVQGPKVYKSHLPRSTPIRDRLRTAEERRKNSRFKDFLINWKSYGEKE